MAPDIYQVDRINLGLNINKLVKQIQQENTVQTFSSIRPTSYLPASLAGSLSPAFGESFPT